MIDWSNTTALMVVQIESLSAFEMLPQKLEKTLSKTPENTK